MLLPLLVFPLLTLIISTEYFIYPFIVSKKSTLCYVYIITADLCILLKGVAVDTWFTRSKLSFEWKYRFQDNGILEVLSLRVR